MGNEISDIMNMIIPLDLKDVTLPGRTVLFSLILKLMKIMT